MQLSTRNSLKAAPFLVSAVWRAEAGWMAGEASQPAGVFIRLTPAVAELESVHCAVGLIATLDTGLRLPYTLAKQEEDGHLVLFVPGTTPSLVPQVSKVGFTEN